MSGGGKLAPGRGAVANPAEDLEHLRKPGKGTLVTSMRDYVDHGSTCERAPAQDGCELDADARARLEGAVRRLIDDAEKQWRDALRVVQVILRIHKDEELGFLAMVLIEMVGGRLEGFITGAVKALRAAGLKRIERAVLDAGIHGDALKPFASEGILNALTDDNVKGLVKSFVSAGKRKARTGGRDALAAGARGGREGKISYLDTLQDEGTKHWIAFRELGVANATDLELLAMLDAMNIDNHTSSLYQQSIRDHLGRLDALHLERIGRNDDVWEGGVGLQDDDDTANGFRGIGLNPIASDIRLVRIVYASKRTPQLAFQHQERSRPSALDAVLEPLPAPGTAPARPVFGDSPAYGGAPRGRPALGRSPSDQAFYVPREFTAIAIAKHREAWGGDPPDYFVDDRPPAPPRMTLDSTPAVARDGLAPDTDRAGALLGRTPAP